MTRRRSAHGTREAGAAATAGIQTGSVNTLSMAASSAAAGCIEGTISVQPEITRLDRRYRRPAFG